MTCNIFIERLWKSVKYEDIHLKAYGSIAEVKKRLANYFMFYNERRWHQNFDRKTPAMVCFSNQPQKQAAALPFLHGYKHSRCDDHISRDPTTFGMSIFITRHQKGCVEEVYAQNAFLTNDSIQ